MKDSFGARCELEIDGRSFEYFRLSALEHQGFAVQSLPYSLRILLENLLRHEDGTVVTADDIRALAGWQPAAEPEREIAFTPARVLLQDFTGVPALVDLAAMRDAMVALGGDASRINPQQPVELVVDHSIQVDSFGSPDSFRRNEAADYRRNQERYAFLKWGQQAFANFRVLPPNTGICHQVNLEFLARVVFGGDGARVGSSGLRQVYPDTVVGTDSHTTMVNGLGVLGWGVGGIEAEAAMLGQPVSMLIPRVVGVKLLGRLREGVTASDLVLVITEMLRRHGVVGKFVEFHGPGARALTLADRATIANMAPEYGATCGLFPVDAATLEYLRFTGRSDRHVALVERYLKAQGLYDDGRSPAPSCYSDLLELDLASVQPSIAGPRRPQERMPLEEAKRVFAATLPSLRPSGAAAPVKEAALAMPAGQKDIGIWGEGVDDEPAGRGADLLRDGSVVIAAITSCTNTSNPSVMLAAGLLAKAAVDRGLRVKPWVKTSLAPGSRVVEQYYERAGLSTYLDQLGFQTVGHGCTTCIGNSGPLPRDISQAIQRRELVVASVLSGNRNFEGRIHSEVRANFLMSPPLVVAFALVGRIDIDLLHEPLGQDERGEPVFLKDIWPSSEAIERVLRACIQPEMYRDTYRDVYGGDAHWREMAAPDGDRFEWDPESTYVRRPPYFEGMRRAAPATVDPLRGARVLVSLGDGVTTDHISPAGGIRAGSPAGAYLSGHGVSAQEFNSYGSRRGNHEVMVRGTFANGRIRNRLTPTLEGGFSCHLPSGDVGSIYDIAARYQAEGVPLIVLAGKEYGSGSSRDWAAKGPHMQGVKIVMAQSYERIHRSNLVGMGILPLQFRPGETIDTLGLRGDETFDVPGLPELIDSGFSGGRDVTVRVRRADGSELEFSALVRLDTPQEVLYYRHGGILRYVLRQLLGERDRPKAISPPKGSVNLSCSEPVADDRHLDEMSEESFPASDPPPH